MIDVATIDETTVNGYREGYSEVLIQHLSKKLGWSYDLTRRALRDAIRFLGLCAIPPVGAEESDSVLVDFTWEPRVMVSSKVVDEVVDEIFLNTRLLIWLESDVLMVNRLMHVPSYEHGTLDSAIMRAHYDLTIAMMRAAGYEIDEDIWSPMAHSTCTASNDLEDCKMYAVR